MVMEQHVKAYATFFETLEEDCTMRDFEKVFDDNAYFEDPFQKVNGIDAIYGIFRHMYESVDMPRFIINEQVYNKQCAYLRWTFSYKQNHHAKKVEKFTGVSRVQFLESGKVVSHIDYWDAGEHIYEKVPVLGGILRIVKKKIQA